MSFQHVSDAAAAVVATASALAVGDYGTASELAAEARARAGAEIVRRREAALRLSSALACAHPEDARTICDAFLATAGAGLPPATWPETVRDDARFWADMASESELVEFAAAALREIGQRDAVLPLRKRMLAALFQSLPAEDRRQFLARVDPRGRYQARA